MAIDDSIMKNERPLVSLCITCYNQEKYIREALQSAFKQTYSPLEIIICDDCSTDGTDHIIKSMIETYRNSGGVHRIIYQRNDENLFVARNYEKAFRIAHGVLRVTGAGDDISEPYRIEKIVEIWKKALEKGRNISCILHAWTNIDESSKVGLVCGPWDVKTPLGAAATYSQDVFLRFPPLLGKCNFYEDDILTLRALSIGDILSSNLPLIRYRTTSGLSHLGKVRFARSKMAKAVIESCEEFKIELEGIKDKITQDRYLCVQEVMLWKMRHYTGELQLCSGRFWWNRMMGFLKLKKADGLSFWQMRYRILTVFPEWLEKIAIVLILQVKKFFHK